MTNIDDIIADLKTDDPMTSVLEVIETLENAQKRIEELKKELQCEKIYSLNCRLGNVDASEGELQRKVDELVEVITRLASLELMGITPEKTDWLEIYQKEFNARIDYARAALKQEGE